jgi:hypothetical protein
MVRRGFHPPRHEHPRESAGRPGARAPHVFLERDGGRLSTLDLFGRDFVLLAGPDGEAWRAAASAAAKELGVTLDVYLIGDNGLTDAGGSFSGAFGISPSGAVLVRPEVLGLVSGKFDRMEPPDQLAARISEASGFFPLEQLALSTQCGFASAGPGNQISEDAQENKLRLVGEVADRIWG